MTNFERLKRQLNGLYALTTAQRAARLGLRALWLGIAGGLLGWGVHAIWGWLPNPMSWFLLGLIFALLPIGVVVGSLTTPSRWVRSLDQKLGFREEVNTAWEVSRKNQPGVINDLLVEDVLARIPKVREQTLRAGWFREIDLAATMIIVVLACTLLFSLLIPPPQPMTDETPTEAAPQTQQQPEHPPPPTGQNPGQEQGSEGQSGQAGSQDQNGQPSGGQPENGSANDGQAGQEAPANAPVPDEGAVAQALRDLGSALSQQAGTYDLGQALENMDLQGAANEMGNLGDQLDGLSPESRDNLAKSLEKAAGALDQAGQQGLADEMGNAAEALAGSNDQAAQALDKVAGELSKLDDAMQASGGAGPGTAPQKGDGANTGNPEPLSRLNEEGGEVQLPLEPDGAPQSELLGPASPDAIGKGTASGSLDRTKQSGQAAVQSPLLPNTLLWKWRDVISQYFSR